MLRAGSHSSGHRHGWEGRGKLNPSQGKMWIEMASYLLRNRSKCRLGRRSVPSRKRPSIPQTGDGCIKGRVTCLKIPADSGSRNQARIAVRQAPPCAEGGRGDFKRNWRPNRHSGRRQPSSPASRRPTDALGRVYYWVDSKRVRVLKNSGVDELEERANEIIEVGGYIQKKKEEMLRRHDAVLSEPGGELQATNDLDSYWWS